MSAGQVKDRRQRRRDNGGLVFTLAFVLIGVACFAAAVYFAITGMMNCGGTCRNASATDILFSEFRFMGLFCAGAILLVISIVVFMLFRWGLFAERVPWQELHGRRRIPP